MHAASAPPYDRDALVLLAQTPRTLFVYWQLSPRREALLLEHFGAPWRELTPALRLYDITGLAAFDGSSACGYRDIPLPDGSSCFLDGFTPGASYTADLGVVSAQRQFVALLRGNPVTMPVPAEAAGMTAGVEAGGASQTLPLSAEGFVLVMPEEYAQFSAYSVYAPAQPDEGHGGDS